MRESGGAGVGPLINGETVAMAEREMQSAESAAGTGVRSLCEVEGR